MSKAAVNAKKLARQKHKENDKINTVYKRVEEFAAADTHMAACWECGLVQVNSQMTHQEDRFVIECVLCGCETARYM